MDKEDSILQLQVNMQRAPMLNRTVASEQAAKVRNDIEAALNVVTVYQDPLTRHWATELWDRVGQVIGKGGIGCKSWEISDLTQALVFADAVQAAAAADVLVISVRDAGELPLFLHVWIDAWMPRRVGRAGALVALIGVPTQPDAQSGRAHQYLQAVARRAGLDFLSRERKLPAEHLALSTRSGVTAGANLARLSLLEGGNSRNWLINRNPIQKVCTKSARVSL